MPEATALSFKAVASGLQGALKPPGDKSISHRAAIFSLLADGVSEIEGFLQAEDTLATLAACEQLGAGVVRDNNKLKISGVGLNGLLRPANGLLDMGNSGTAMRLFAGVLSAQSFAATLSGDASLNTRPMSRVVKPLQQMGAKIQSNNGSPPLQISPSPGLQAIEYQSPVASAQVKSCLLLAAICAGVTASLTEPLLSRDHSERMLRDQGAKLKSQGSTVKLLPTTSLQPLNMQVPADISSAAFAVVASLIVPGSNITIANVSNNPTRARLLDILRQMGAEIEITAISEQAGEPVADLRVRSSKLHGVDVPIDWVPGMIDEFPILMVAAAVASGVTRVRGAAELRVKESDRIAVMSKGLRQLGVRVDEYADGFDVYGDADFAFRGGEVDGHGDHRCAMSLLVCGLRSKQRVCVLGTEMIATSYPDFIADMRALGADLDE